MSVSDQVMMIFAGTQGYLDKVPVEKVKDFETQFLKHVNEQHSELLDDIQKSGQLTNLEKAQKVCADFAENYRSKL